MMGRMGRLWRTLRHLHLVQFYGRLWFRLHRPRPDMSAAPLLRPGQGVWRAPAQREPSLVEATRFRFLNHEADMDDVGWDDPDQSKLWRYNQHYFDDLTARGSQQRADWHYALIARWIQENAPGHGSGWEPYPVSLRIINWIKWNKAGGSLSSAAIHSLAVQARWLMRRLEWHLLGNHLFINAKALVFAGLFFDGPEAERWLAKGLAILARELDEQFLPDGGQFELSPMYHALATEDLLDLVNIAAAYPERPLGAIEARLRTKAQAALQWLAAMSHPDGGIAFFNDAAFGVAPANEQLFSYADRLDLAPEAKHRPLVHLAASGYVRMARGPFVVLADLARVGPDYLPGHAHADTLSFELSVGDQRVFVNSGTSEYGTGPERQRQRGTAAHNCLWVGHENSSEVWAGFRVGRRACPREVRIDESDGALCVQASHDGYRHLKGRPMPHRRFELTDDAFVVDDSLTSPQRAQAHYHLHPSVEVAAIAGGGATLVLPDGMSFHVETAGGPLRCEEATWHPGFGISEDTHRLVLPLWDGAARLRLKVLRQPA